jgi:shikimate dehydrogenase
VRVVDRPGPADIVVNATSVGLHDDDLAPLPLDGVAGPEVAVDLVYREGQTPFAAWASRVGARVVDGLEVLVQQGALSFRIWTGRDAPVDVMRAEISPHA